MEDQQDTTQEKGNSQTLRAIDTLKAARILLDMMGHYDEDNEDIPDTNNYKEVEDEQEKRQAEQYKESEPGYSTGWWSMDKFNPYTLYDPTTVESPLDVDDPDPINNPSHYMLFAGEIEVIDLIEDRLTEEEFIGYLKGNMIKYHMRAGHKDSLTKDLQKLRKYTDWLLETMEATDV